MADGFYKEVCKLIAAAGFSYSENAKGSHEKWRNENSGKTLIIPRKIKSRHTANGILKDAGIQNKF